MKKSFSFLAAATALCSTAAMAANGDRSVVVAAQDQLNRLGYYSGHEDGVLGSKTRNALVDFQRTNGLAATGTLTPETYAALGSDERYYGRYRGAQYRSNVAWNTTYPNGTYQNSTYQNVAYQNIAVQPANWPTISAIPIRYGNMTVAETASTGGLRNYTVSLNGQPVLYATNQPSQLHYAHNMYRNGEDSLVFNVYDAASSCNTKSYAMSVRSDGTFVPAREIANCGGALVRWNEDGRYNVSSR